MPKRQIEQYEHKGKERANNPPVGLVTPDTDIETGRMSHAFDPHLDPTLQWAGKAEHTSFDIPTVSLHVHERYTLDMEQAAGRLVPHLMRFVASRTPG